MADDELSGPEIMNKVSHGSNRGDDKELSAQRVWNF